MYKIDIFFYLSNFNKNAINKLKNNKNFLLHHSVFSLVYIDHTGFSKVYKIRIDSVNKNMNTNYTEKFLKISQIILHILL